MHAIRTFISMSAPIVAPFVSEEMWGCRKSSLTWEAAVLIPHRYLRGTAGGGGCSADTVRLGTYLKRPAILHCFRLVLGQ